MSLFMMATLIIWGCVVLLLAAILAVRFAPKPAKEVTEGVDEEDTAEVDTTYDVQADPEFAQDVTAEITK